MRARRHLRADATVVLLRELAFKHALFHITPAQSDRVPASVVRAKFIL